MSHKAAKRARQERRSQTAEFVDEFTLALVLAFQRRFKERAGAHYVRSPEAKRPCGTCAMNPSTNDWQGRDNTALQFVTSLVRQAPFYCHDGWPEGPDGWKVDPKEADLCAGWWVVLGDEGALLASAREAFAAVGTVIPESPSGDATLNLVLEELARSTAGWRP